jgi:zinc transporter ZupT
VSTTFQVAFTASAIAALITTSGILAIRYLRDWGERNTVYFMCFAAGVLISASFLHIVPKSIAMNLQAPAWLLAGFFGLYLLNRFITGFVCQRNPDRREHAIGLIPLIGIGFHSLIDGAIYSIAFTVSILTGVLSTFGMVLHEFPEGIVTYLLLLRGGFAERRATLLAFLAAALTTPVGMLLSYPVVSVIEQKTLGALLAVSAGALIYVGATHLLPRAEQEHGRYSLVALAGGVLVAVIVVVSKS